LLARAPFADFPLDLALTAMRCLLISVQIARPSGALF
jgi:hypothetical protein